MFSVCSHESVHCCSAAAAGRVHGRRRSAAQEPAAVRAADPVLPARRQPAQVQRVRLLVRPGGAGDSSGPAGQLLQSSRQLLRGEQEGGGLHVAGRPSLRHRLRLRLLRPAGVLLSLQQQVPSGRVRVRPGGGRVLRSDALQPRLQVRGPQSPVLLRSPTTTKNTNRDAAFQAHSSRF